MRHRMVSQPDFDALSNGFRSTFAQTLEQLVAAALRAEDVAPRLAPCLYERHREAALLGRWLGGGRDGYGQTDEAIALKRAGHDASNLGRMGRMFEKAYGYSGQEESIRKAFESFVCRLRGTANEAFVFLSPQDSLFDWVCLNEHPCAECRGLSKRSPLRQGDFTTLPGDQGTKCGAECGCVLVRYFERDRLPPVIGFARTFEPGPDLSGIDPSDLPDLDKPLTPEESANWFGI